MSLRKAVATAALGIGMMAPSVSAQEHEIPDAPDVGVSLAVNALSNGVLAGIGALINGEDIPEAFAYGLQGGAYIGFAKYMVGQNPDLGWPARIVGSIGSSMTSNAARGNEPLGKIGMNFGPLYLEAEKTDSGFDVRPYLDIGIILGIEEMRYRGHEMDWGRTLRSGFITFRNTSENLDVHGRTLNGVVLYTDDGAHKEWESCVLGHEKVHGFQFALPGAVKGLLEEIFPDNTGIERFEDDMHLNVSNSLSQAVSYRALNWDPVTSWPEQEAYSFQCRP